MASILRGIEGLFFDLERLYSAREEGIIVGITHDYARDVVERARQIIQEGGPSNPSWPPLAESTVETRIREGYTPNDPLIREGNLMNDIDYTVEVHMDSSVAIIGIPEGAVSAPYAMVQELGSIDPAAHGAIPPRPFMGPALRELEGEFRAVTNAKVARWDSYFKNALKNGKH